MAQRFLFDEDHQLPAKITRAVIWSGTMALSVALPFVVVGAAIVGADYHHSHTSAFDDPNNGLWIVGFVLLGILIATISILYGSIIGFIAAIQSSGEEPFWPMRSPIFLAPFRKLLTVDLFVCFYGTLFSITQAGFTLPLVSSALFSGYVLLWLTKRKAA